MNGDNAESDLVFISRQYCSNVATFMSSGGRENKFRDISNLIRKKGERIMFVKKQKNIYFDVSIIAIKELKY